MEVPVEVLVEVPGETQTVEGPGKTVTVTKEVEVPAATVEEAEVEIAPLALAIDENLSILPPKKSSSAGRAFSLAATEYDLFEEKIVTWNEAQKPLDTVNNFLCVIAKTKYNEAANRDSMARAKLLAEAAAETDIEVATAYSAKVTMKECFKSNDDMANAAPAQGGGGGGGNDKNPTDIKVEVSKKKKKALAVKIWFTANLSDLSSGGTDAAGTAALEGSSEPRLRNYYMELTIAEPVSDENPFGLFEMYWNSYDLTDGVEGNSPNGDGYIKVYRKKITNDLMLEFYDSVTSVDMWSQDWSNTVRNRAIAKLDVKALMDDNKKVTGYTIKGGDAHTAMSYAWDYIGSDAGLQTYSGNNDSGSYSLAFDEDYAVTKFNLSESHTNYGTDYSGQAYNPEAPNCTTRNEVWANVWEYAMFSEAGQRISHQTGFMIETGKRHPEWDYPLNGWIGRWGLWVEGVNNGDTVELVNWETGDRTPMIYSQLNGRLMDNNWMDITIPQASNLTLTCTSQCPKTTITQTDINNSTPYLDDLAGPYTYVFNAGSKKLTRDGTEVKFASGVDATGTTYEWGTVIDSSMLAGAESYRWQMSLDKWNKPAGLRVKNSDGSAGSWFVVPEPLEFQPFVYNDDADAYDDNKNPANDGKIYNIVYDGWMSGINWESKANRKDQWGYDMWGPEIVLRRGVKLTAVNTTGAVKAGEKITLAPRITQHTAKSRNFLSQADIGVTKDGCSMSLQERALWIQHDMDLPEAISGQDIRSKIGPPPGGEGDEELKVLFVNGEAVGTN